MAKKIKSTTNTTFESKTDRDDLVTSFSTELNKSSKDGKVAYFLDDQDDPSAISDWISTGSSILDLAISNRPNGGLPVGRLVEFNGLEGTGKSLIAAHVICDTQKKGGVAVIIDTENSAAPEFWKSLGVDLTNLSYIPCETVEEIFEHMENIISIIRKSNKDRLVTIIVDSVAGASTKAELEADHGSQGYATQKAIILGKAMRKITNMIGRQKILILFTNQLRQNLNAAQFGDKFIVSGGKALQFHCSVRVRLSNMGKLKKGDNIIGNKCKCVVIKNRMGPPQRKAEFDIYFDSGIADYSSWLNVLKVNSIITGAGGNSPYGYKCDSGEKVSFLSREFVNLMSTNPTLKAELYSKICDAVIMKYKDPNSAIVDGVEVESEEEESTDVSDE